jgi:hypothetical protein
LRKKKIPEKKMKHPPKKMQKQKMQWGSLSIAGKK